MKTHIKDIATFGKLSISLPVAVTCLTGYVLFDEHISWHAAIAASGIFFLSAGASAINQLQERKADSLMPRTQQRPLPLGKLNPVTAALIIFTFLAIGTFTLAQFNLQAVIWGWIGVFWYNLIYTPLKRKTAFSIFPGAIVGAIPPVAGWVAAGGSYTDIRIHFLAFFFFLGQMPHFWLLVLKYKKQYKMAGFPVITDYLTNLQLIRINMIWFIATLVSILFLPALSIISSRWVAITLSISVAVMMLWIIKSTYLMHKSQMTFLLKQQFIYFNSFYLWIMLLIMVEQL